MKNKIYIALSLPLAIIGLITIAIIIAIKDDDKTEVQALGDCQPSSLVPIVRNHDSGLTFVD